MSMFTIEIKTIKIVGQTTNDERRKTHENWNI